MQRRWSIGAFHLDDHGVIDQQIDSICLVYFATAVDQRKNILLPDEVTASAEFVRKKSLVCRLEEAGAKIAVERYRRFDNRCRNAGVLWGQCHA